MKPDVASSIRARIAAGRLPLPANPPGKMWVGPGNLRPCDGCDQPITDAEMEYETDLPTGQTIRFHRPCFEAWQTEGAGARTFRGMLVCAYCGKPIEPTESKVTVEGEVYHGICWERKSRRR
jgi:hypothetical protein